jgi:hypothetical protein
MLSGLADDTDEKFKMATLGLNEVKIFFLFQDLAKDVLEYMVSKLGNDDVCSIQPILEQIQLISMAHPGLLAPHIDTICQYEEASSSAAVIIHELKQMEALTR